MRHLASVGFQHDGYLNVWNWRKGTKVASNRVTSRVNAMAFAQDGTHFITAGLRHIKFWNLSSTGKSPLQVNILVDRLWERYCGHLTFYLAEQLPIRRNSSVGWPRWPFRDTEKQQLCGCCL
jgi:hypothetical protein